MEESSQKINPTKLKSFVRNVCILAKKHKDREEARSDLQKQIQKLKKFSSKKKEMDEELKNLDRKVSLVLEKEAQLLGTKKEESTTSKALMENVMENKAKIDQIYNSVNELNKKVKDYIEMKTERERRIQKLERKISTSAESKKEIPLLKNRLKTLEAKYSRLKNQGHDVSQVAKKIQDLKLRLG